MLRTSPVNSDITTTPTNNASSILASQIRNHPSPISSANASDDIVKYRASPFQYADYYSPSRLSTEPRTPLNSKVHQRSDSRSSSVLPTPPDSLTRLQQQQAMALEAHKLSSPPPANLSFSHMSDPIVTPSRYTGRRLDTGRIRVVDTESDFICGDPHILGSPHILDGSSPVSGRLRSMSHPLEVDTSSNPLKDGISFSETASLLSAVSIESNTDSAGGSATCKPCIFHSCHGTNHL